MCYSLNIPPFLKFGIYSAVLFLYLALGTVFFYFTETHDIGISKFNLISKKSLLFTGNKNSLIKRTLTLNFQTAIISYVWPEASFIPSTEFGKYFSVFFILLGYFTVGLVFSNIFEILIEKQNEIAKTYFKLAQPKICLVRLGIFMFINIICATIQIGTYLIIEKWSFSDSFYFAFCTR
jgi:hypothetical protein